MEANELVPLHDLVVIERDADMEKTKGGIFIPPKAQERQETGTVVSAGPGKLGPGGVFIETTVKRGDRVLFRKMSGEDVQVNGQKLVLLPFDHLMAVLR